MITRIDYSCCEGLSKWKHEMILDSEMVVVREDRALF
jgi:hypothetical protein